ncbi:MAG: DUF3040 domain-containing protein [Micrococcales bacterium]|nr:DUF3040 domain-containing protein [Micrococcales bacterium]
MPLSEYEQRVLEQMERHLSTDDPRLATRLTQRDRPASRYFVAVVGTLAGILALVLGVALGPPLGVALGAAGFVAMFAAVAFAFSKPRRPKGAEQAGPATRSARPARRGVMDVFEERWNRRRGQ